jgi:hypothetical protein
MQWNVRSLVCAWGGPSLTTVHSALCQSAMFGSPVTVFGVGESARFGPGGHEVSQSGCSVLSGSAPGSGLSSGGAAAARAAPLPVPGCPRSHPWHAPREPARPLPWLDHREGQGRALRDPEANPYFLAKPPSGTSERPSVAGLRRDTPPRSTFTQEDRCPARAASWKRRNASR